MKIFIEIQKNNHYFLILQKFEYQEKIFIEHLIENPSHVKSMQAN